MLVLSVVKLAPVGSSAGVFSPCRRSPARGCFRVCCKVRLRNAYTLMMTRDELENAKLAACSAETETTVDRVMQKVPSYAPDPWLLKRLRKYYGLDDEQEVEQTP